MKTTLIFIIVLVILEPFLSSEPATSITNELKELNKTISYIDEEILKVENNLLQIKDNLEVETEKEKQANKIFAIVQISIFISFLIFSFFCSGGEFPDVGMELNNYIINIIKRLVNKKVMTGEKTVNYFLIKLPRKYY